MLKNRRDKLLETVYLSCFVIYTTISLIAFSPAKDIFSPYISQKSLFTVANWGTIFFLLFVYIFKHHISKKEIVAELFIAALFTVVTFTNQTVSNVFHLTQWTMFFAVGMFIICATVTTFKRLTITSLLTTLITVAVFYILSSKDIIANFTKDHAGSTAHFMGFYYYTHPSYYMVFAWLAYMYLRGDKKIAWLELVAEFVALCMLHNYTTCRLATVCTVIAFALYIIIVKFSLINLNWKISRFASAAAFGASAIFTLLCGYFYSPENAFLAKFNSIISGRHNLVNQAFSRYDINFFGRLITPPESGAYFYLDSCYAYSLFGCGLIFFIAVIAMYSYMSYCACKNNDKYLLIWLATLAIFGIVGDVWVHISYTPLILGFFIMLRKEGVFQKEKGRQILTSDTHQYL